MTRRAWLITLPAFVACWLCVSTSCSSSDAPSSASGGTGAGDAAEAGPGFSDTDCGKCVFSACASQVTECDADPSCATYLTCLRACSVDAWGYVDAACEAGCPSPAQGAGTTALAALAACREYALASDCKPCRSVDADASNPIANQNCPPSTQTDICKKCLEETCCETSAACAGDPDCSALVSCAQGCDTGAGYAACMDNCFSQHPKGAQGYAQDLGCFLTLCSETTKCPWATPGACTECYTKNCTETMLACDADPECFLIELCIGDCNASAQCVLDCQHDRSAGAVAKFEARAVCRHDQCASVCE